MHVAGYIASISHGLSPSLWGPHSCERDALCYIYLLHKMKKSSIIYESYKHALEYYLMVHVLKQGILRDQR